jgi:nicotinate-nucleotide adenylyltransferase
MQIALFGGAFDPPHKGHQQIITQVLEHHIVEEVWLVPVKNHPFGKGVSPATDRVAMLQPLLSKRVRIEKFELEEKGPSYTLYTLDTLSAQYPEHRFSWIIGSDNLPNFHKWFHYQEMLQKYTFYVYPRKGFPFTPLYPGMEALHNIPEIEVSSTEVREKVQDHEPVTGLVDPQVEQYIKDHNLYL